MPKTKTSPVRGIPVAREALNARPDTIDFRDKMYVPTLVEVPTHISLADYRAGFKKRQVPILDQKKEGACTGFGLAAVANFLLQRRKVVPDATPVSPRMFYEMARRYDEWPGEAYSGSSARGAMKGWHKHGVCAERSWSYEANAAGTLTPERVADAASRPLGAYFRVNHLDLVAMHSALAEVGVLYATATVHRGWGEVGRDGSIPVTDEALGGHAFAIVGYDVDGFWIQNSWGPRWGLGGFARISYDDWLANGTDVWVARLGAPVSALQTEGKTATVALSSRTEFSFSDLRPHIISIGNDGYLRPSGQFGTDQAAVATIFQQDIPRLTKGWTAKRLLLYAHGGLVSEQNALQRVEEYRRALLDKQVYPLAFIWRTDFWSTLGNILKDAIGKRKPEGLLDSMKDFMLDRLDDTLEPLARPLGKALWDEMKENAILSSVNPKGGARLVLNELVQLLDRDPSWEIHVAGHSAGSIFTAPLVQLLCTRGTVANLPGKGQAGFGRKVASVTLWAPACTMNLFHNTFLPCIKDGSIERFSLFTLKDAAEQADDCAKVYHKSLLYLVSNAFEEKAGIFFLKGEPLLGLENFILRDPAFKTPPAGTVNKTNPPVVPLFGLLTSAWIRSPNSLPVGESTDASAARHHGDFDDDKATVLSTLARILGRSTAQARLSFNSSGDALQNRRKSL